MPKKKEQPPQLPASVAVTGIPGPRGEPSVLNGDYELEEGQEMNGCARWPDANAGRGSGTAAVKVECPRMV